MSDIYVLDYFHIYACSVSGGVYVTNDFFNSWKQLNDGNDYLQKYKVVFTDSLHGWMAGGRIDNVGFIRYSGDGGINWITKLIASEPLYDLWFQNPDTMFTVGGDPEYGGWIYVSIDKGESWQLQNTNFTSGALNSISFMGKFGWVTGIGGILMSENYGTSWKQVVKVPKAYTHSLCSNRKTFWFCGSKGGLLRYTDTTSGSSTVHEEKMSKKQILMNAYPNPFNGNITIEVQTPNENLAELKIYNILGEQVLSVSKKELFAGRNTLQLNFEFLPTGIYIVNLKLAGNVLNTKIILQK
ncbi:MAG: T9SS type A sorting domain-containing protein [Ignavibacteria bacterium]|nr:T9SS type A sorting domain-containing protein [Ignavibacteria bacterium]